MRLKWSALLLAAMLTPQAAQAFAKTVICDGCGETEYGKMALRAADGTESILVYDGSNAQLRKYRVSQSGDREGTRIRSYMNRAEPSDKETAFFEDWLLVYGALSHFLETCGPGSIGDYSVPDLGFALACEQHDICYAAGGTASDRSQCDQDLFNTMINMGASWDLAVMYYLAVRAAGWMYFQWSKIYLSSSWDSPFGCANMVQCDFTELAPIPQ
jgi:hypothetical protein